MYTLADKYYIKASDVYPYDIEETLENLEYALSYNTDHVAANTLMGVLRMESFHDYAGAEEHFCIAMAADPSSADTCMKYVNLLLKLRKTTKAGRVLDYLDKLEGAQPDRVLAARGRICELQKNFGQALYYLRQAMLECFDSDYITFLEEEISRIESKKQMVSIAGAVIV